MANTPNKPNSYACVSIAGFDLEEKNEKGTQIFAFQEIEPSDRKGSHNAGMPHNSVVPAVMQWSPGASTAEGIISFAEKESKMDMQAPHSGTPGGSNEIMLGLELGKRTYFKVPGGGPSGVASQALGSTLPRKHRIAGQSPVCQVEGCKSDLSSAKPYHRRHKVCPVHSKAPCVIVRGEEQRFCQQCSRFHGLDAFDEGKRSCRNRLEGHNKRRRKPQPDPFGLTTRFLPNFQDSGRLGQLFTDSSFLPHMRIQGISALWDDGNPPDQRRGSWQQQRMLTFEDRSTFDCSTPAGEGVERQLFTGVHQHPNDRSTLFSPQSPKGMIPGSSDVGGSPKMHQYFHGSANPLGPSLSLTSSSGAGVLSGLESIPVGQGFARVSDSGRALSLQSTLQFLSSTQGMIADITTHSNAITDQDLQSSHIPTAEPLVQGSGHHHHHCHFDWAHDKLLSAASSLQSLSSTTTGYQTGTMSMSKDHLEEPFAHGLNGVTGFDSVPIYSMFHGDLRLGDMPQDVKPTMDLMQVVTSASHGLSNQPLLSTGSFDLGGASHFSDLQALRSYEPPMDDSSPEV